MSCGVMWCDVIWFWCDVISCVASCHVMKRNVMWFDVLSCDELSSVVTWCDAMGWDLMSLWCDVAGCKVKALQNTTLYYSSTTLYYKVLVQYYEALRQYYVLLQYYSVLQSIIPVPHDWSSWHMKRHLQCAEQPSVPSNITKYCACHAKWLSSLILVTYETSFTMRGATKCALQHHQILRLSRRMTFIVDPRDIWNVIYSARSNQVYPATSPNTAPATQI